MAKQKGKGKIMLNMPILNKLRVLIAQKEVAENRRLSYRQIASEANVSLSILSAYAMQKVNRFDGDTLEKLCRYFSVQPGDLLVLSDVSPQETPPAKKQKASRK